VKLNLEAISDLTTVKHISAAERLFGQDEGAKVISSLVDGIKEFFKHFSPEDHSARFVFLSNPRLKTQDFELPWSNCGIQFQSLRRKELHNWTRKINADDSVYVWVKSEDCFEVSVFNDSVDLESWAQNAVLFANDSGKDTFFIGGNTFEMPQIAHGFSSIYATPTISDLNLALEKYANIARKPTCLTLQQVWYGGVSGPRLVFVTKPEHIMRDSLYQYLNYSLVSDATVRREHNTDATKPVDIFVDWFGVRSRALIEVKWLGEAIAKGLEQPPFTYTKFSNSRAQEGMQQLVDYMDREECTDPDTKVQGYLVVIDGRRRGITPNLDELPEDQAFHYQDKGIELSRDYSEERDDVESVRHIFMEPNRARLAVP